MLDIEIVEISPNRQFCKDINGKVYNINAVKKAIKSGKTINVYIRRNNRKPSAFSEILVRKHKSSIVKNNNLRNKKTNIDSKIIYAGNKLGIHTELILITEDKGSAGQILINILERFAIDHNLYIKCNFIRTNGVTNIPYVISNYLKDKLPNCRRCIIVYDSAIEDFNNINTVNNINEYVDYIKYEGYRVVVFKPTSSEECALTFKYLAEDLIDLDTKINMRKILNTMYKYLKSGDFYIKLNNYTMQYEIDGIPLGLPYNSQFIKKYKTIDSVERYLADKLLYLTCDGPYEFDKSASSCWNEDCGTEVAKCAIVQKFGSLNKNAINRVNKCNKTLIGKDKTFEIIAESLFGGLYEALGFLYGKNIKILNSKVSSRVLKKFKEVT